MSFDDAALLLLVDHSSRQDLESIENAIGRKIVVEKSHANTSPYLKAVGQDVNQNL